MIGISKIHPGQFGNRLLHYGNLRQLAHFLGRPFHCVPIPDTDIFDLAEPSPAPTEQGTPLVSETLLMYGKDRIKAITEGVKLLELGPVLGEIFFWFDELDTHEMFRFNKRIRDDVTDIFMGTHIALHFRGRDFHQWDPNAILSTHYYLSALDQCLEGVVNPTVHLYTDDRNLESYRKVFEYVVKEGLFYDVGNSSPEDFKKDFIMMAHCDYLISSPSTFCIAAGFCGKRDKKIIHSADWIHYRIKENDSFWTGLVRGGNRNYRMWRAA